jgi:phosphoribosyl 1,2-cyclic phosphate phosphodiesterase
MKLTFLGTGTSQGIPVIGCNCSVCTSSDPRDKRLRTSAMVSVGGKNIVIDTGPDFRQQMLETKPENVDAVVFTHEHKDHIAGLDDIRPFNFKTGKALNIFASDQVQVALKREYHYVFADHKYPGVPEVNLHHINPKHSFMVDGVKFEPVEVLHYKLPVLGFRVGKLAYITDANFIAEEEKRKLKGLDVLVLNALRKKKHISHFNLEEAIAMVRELKPRRAFFTHISHLMGKHEEVSRELPENIQIAHDFQVVEVDD